MMAERSGNEYSRVEDFVADFLAERQRESESYTPREDSFLMLEALADFELEGFKILDLGTGSGILAAFCARQGGQVTASDIDANSIEEFRSAARRLGLSIRSVVSDLFSQIDERFDIVIFNPPYLPSEGIMDRSVDGGHDGNQVIGSFLSKLPEHLTEMGFGMLLLSSLNRPERLMLECPKLHFEKTHERSLFFEHLYVFKITKT
jgi:release factor glutamine methyltransferase